MEDHQGNRKQSLKKLLSSRGLEDGDWNYKIIGKDQMWEVRNDESC